MRQWTTGEDSRLERMVKDGMPEQMIAKQIGRSPKAINVRKSKLGLRYAPAEYLLIGPDGTRRVTNLNAGAGRHTRLSDGLRWALRTGRKYKGWAVKKI